MTRGRKKGHLELMGAADTVQEEEPSICGGRTKAGTPCKRKPGQGTDHPGVGQCLDHEGQVEKGAPCPLPLTPLEARLWEEVSAQLRALGLDKRAFWMAQYGLVSALAGLHNAKEAARAFPVIQDAKGSLKKHPATTIANQMLAHVKGYAAELGLTPAALARVTEEGGRDVPKSKMDQLISGG